MNQAAEIWYRDSCGIVETKLSKHGMMATICCDY